MHKKIKNRNELEIIGSKQKHEQDESFCEISKTEKSTATDIATNERQHFCLICESNYSTQVCLKYCLLNFKEAMFTIQIQCHAFEVQIYSY